MDHFKKQSLREEVRLRLFKKLAEIDKEEADNAICRSLFDMLRPFGVCGSFCAIKGGPNLTCLIEKRSKTQFLYPKVNGDELDFYKAETESDLIKFEKSPFGVKEPTADFEKVGIEQVDVFLVPGVAFDKRGYRLGRGKGYYDRLLDNTKALKIGICYSWQIQDQDLEVEAHDQKMDYIVCENNIYSLTSNS